MGLVASLICFWSVSFVPSADAQNLKFPQLIPFRQNQPVKPVPLTDSKPPVSGPMSKLFRPEPKAAETALERFQANSKQFFQNSGETMSDWLESTNQSMRRSTEQTWSFFEQSVPQWEWWNAKPKETPYILPPMRSAAEPQIEPKRRF